MAAVATGIGDVGTGAGVGNDITGELGSVLGEGFDLAASGEDSPGGEGGGEAGLPSESPIETPGGEAPTQEAAEIQPETEAQPADANAPWKLSEDGKNYLMPKQEFARVQSAMKYFDTVGQLFSSPQEAQMASSQAGDLRQMSNDWMYGSDDTIRSVMNHWMGGNHQDPGARAAFQRSFGRMVGMAAQEMRQINPQAYQNLTSEVGKSLVDSLWERAAQTNDPNDIRSAQNVEWALSPTGDYRKEPPKVDPQAQARADFERQQRDFTQRQEAALKRDTMAFNQSAVEGAKMGRFGSEIDKVLAPVKGKFGDVAYADIKNGIHREVIDTLTKSDWWTEHKQAFDQLVLDYQTGWRNGAPGRGLDSRIASYIQEFMARAGRILPSVAAKRVNAATQARVSSANGQQRTNGTSRPSNTPRTAASNPPPPANGHLSRDQWDAEFSKMFR
jgi:hypothetical protein